MRDSREPAAHDEQRRRELIVGIRAISLGGHTGCEREQPPGPAPKVGATTGEKGLSS